MVVARDDVGIRQLRPGQTHHGRLTGVETGGAGALQLIQGHDDPGAIVAADHHRTAGHTGEGHILAAATMAPGSS